MHRASLLDCLIPIASRNIVSKRNFINLKNHHACLNDTLSPSLGCRSISQSTLNQTMVFALETFRSDKTPKLSPKCGLKSPSGVVLAHPIQIRRNEPSFRRQAFMLSAILQIKNLDPCRQMQLWLVGSYLML